MIIGTAGHIDHGKTALVRALTGIDTDRLKFSALVLSGTLAALAGAMAEVAATADLFKALAAEALQSNNQSFLTLATQNLETFQQQAKGENETLHALGLLLCPEADLGRGLGGFLGFLGGLLDFAAGEVGEERDHRGEVPDVLAAAEGVHRGGDTRTPTP